MALTPEYKFELVNALDMSLIADIDQARDRSLTLKLNDPGSASFTIPMEDEVAKLLSAVNTGVVVRRNDVNIWSGMVWTIRDDHAAKRAEVGCIGWFERLNHRINTIAYSADNRDAGLIAFDLLDHANVQFTGTQNSDTQIQKGTRDTTQLRSYNFPLYTQNIGEAIRNMSQIESGYDFEVTPDTRHLNIYIRKGSTRQNAIFGYNTGPDNLEPPTFEFDGSQLVNKMIALGPSTVTPGEANDPISISAYTMFMEIPQLSGGNITTETLRAFAGAEVAVRAKPRVSYSLSPIPETSPQVFADYGLGDSVYFSSRGGRVNVTNQLVRIFGMTINIDNNGLERVTELQTTA